MSLAVVRDLLALGVGLPVISLVLPRSDSLPIVTLCAMLEDAGYRRSEIGKLTRWYIKRVLCHPREKDGRVRRPMSRDRAEITWQGHLRRVLVSRKCPPHLIEDRVRELVRRQMPSPRPPKGKGGNSSGKNGR